jgi:hypothetical protein
MCVRVCVLQFFLSCCTCVCICVIIQKEKLDRDALDYVLQYVYKLFSPTYIYNFRLTQENSRNAEKLGRLLSKSALVLEFESPVQLLIVQWWLFYFGWFVDSHFVFTIS